MMATDQPIVSCLRRWALASGDMVSVAARVRRAFVAVAASVVGAMVKEVEKGGFQSPGTVRAAVDRSSTSAGWEELEVVFIDAMHDGKCEADEQQQPMEQPRRRHCHVGSGWLGDYHTFK